MRIFKINKEIEILCEWKKTRTAFKHEATLLINGIEKDKTKICYLNRTWEKYEFESVLEKLINMTNALTQEQKSECLKFLEGDLTDWNNFKIISSICNMGEVLCESQKDKNDFKARMIKAGLGNKGLTFPEDWEKLTESEKERRLNLITQELGKH